MTEQSIDREMELRYAGTCTVCGNQIPKGGRAIYSPVTKTVRHISCSNGREEAPDLVQGIAGASARREYERRTARDQQRLEEQTAQVQAVFGDGFIGRVAARIAVDDRSRQSTAVWEQGAEGEERVGERLAELAQFGVATLNDRRIPGTRANIDHIVVTPWQVWVIDTKRYIGKRPDFYVDGGILGIGGVTRLKVGGRESDQLVEGVKHQLALVQDALGDTTNARGMLCFIDADWPLIGGDFSVRGIRVCWPKRLPKELLKAEPPCLDVAALERQLASRFPAA